MATKGHQMRPRPVGVRAPAKAALFLAGLLVAMVALAACTGTDPTPTATVTPTPTTTQPPTPTVTPDVPVSGLPDIASVVEQVAPSVVSVVTTIRQRDMFGRVRDATSSGSGVIFDERGYILTNNHVVEGGTEVAVVFADDPSRVWPVEVVGTDSLTDLAVLLLDPAQVPYELVITPLRDAEELRVGEWVIAIGNPLGPAFAGTVTVGVVSGTGRFLDLGGEEGLHDLIQTDAVINPGNSGGPLLNLQGEVIGINTAVIRGRLAGGQEAEGIGFAVSTSTAIPVAEQLIANGEVIWPGLGIRVQDVTLSMAIEEGLASNRGVLVVSTAPGGPADVARVQDLDIIVALDDTPVEDVTGLQRLFRTQYSIGDAVDVEVLRNGERLTIVVTLERLSR